MKTVTRSRSLAVVTLAYVIAVAVAVGWLYPNYFGEFGFWVAMALFGVAAAPGQAWWLFAGAAAMLAMFLGASIPMMETRSLQRRLADQGMTFQGLLDETRRHLAEAYLRDERLDLAEIALLLGYSEQSAFTRAFRTWTGLPPAQWLRWATTDLRDA